ncbi:MAG TPA: tetratricopeptide repeat protein [Pirellulales bacterium]
MTQKLGRNRSWAFAVGGGLAAVCISVAGISFGLAAPQDQPASNAPANEQPTNPTAPKADVTPQPIQGVRNPFDEDLSPKSPTPSPGITSPAPLQGPDGAVPVPRGAPQGAAPQRAAPAEGPSGRMPAPNPFDSNTAPKSNNTDQTETPSEGNESRSSATYSPAEQNVNTGKELLKSGNYKEALQSFEEAQKIDPKEPTSYFYQGIVYRQLGRLDDAIDAFSTAADLTTDDLEALAETYLRRGIVWFYKGEYGIAWDDFDEAAINCADNDPRPDLWKGLAMARQNKWLDAVNSYADALHRNDHFGPAYTNRGLAYLMLNEPKKAVENFDQAVRQDPHNAANFVSRGVALARLGKHRDAADSYSQAIRLQPDYADAYFNRSVANRQLGDSQQAEKDRVKAKQLNPNVEKHSNRAG